MQPYEMQTPTSPMVRVTTFYSVIKPNSERVFIFPFHLCITDKSNTILSSATTISNDKTTEADTPVTFTTKFSNKCDIDNKSNNNGNENDECRVDTSKALSELQMSSVAGKKSPSAKTLLNKELEEWIWEDNRYFLQDRNIFEHTYFK